MIISEFISPLSTAKRIQSTEFPLENSILDDWLAELDNATSAERHAFHAHLVRRGWRHPIVTILNHDFDKNLRYDLLALAVEFDQLEIFRFVLDNSLVLDDIALLAIQRGSLAFFQQCLESSAKPLGTTSTAGDKVLLLLIESNRPYMLRCLIDSLHRALYDANPDEWRRIVNRARQVAERLDRFTIQEYLSDLKVH